VGVRSSAQLDDLARAVADGVPRRVVVGRIAAFMAAFLIGDPDLAVGRKKCPRGRKRCGDICCKPGYVCKTKNGKERCVCPAPKKVCGGRCVDTRTDERNCGHCGHRCGTGETCVAGTCTNPPQQQQSQPGGTEQPPATDQPPAPTCNDGVKNGNETDVDCGGPSCPKCANGKACAVATDCASGVCTGGVCVAPPPACSDDVCGAQHNCPPCANGKTCSVGGDCASGHCAGGVCVECATAADCTSTTAAACHAVACTAGVCGQVADDSKVPTAPNDCTNATCTSGTPAFPPKPADTPCSSGVCNGSGNCVGCVNASDCPGTDTECAMRTCTSGACGMTFTNAGTPTSSGPTCSGSTLSTPVCDGSGNVTQNQTSCSPYVCQDSTSCRTSCSSPTDCVAGHTCFNNTCVPVQCTSNSQCSVANGTGVCNQGICQVGTCNPGYANCDGSYATGCERNLNTDVNNCGTCGHPCAFPNASATCISGTCVIQACNPGFLDCDGNPATGCEYSGTTCP
jgi:hypothetical protein